MLANSIDNNNDPDGAGRGEWTPEMQIAQMLDLCEAQMESAVQESDKAVDALIKAFESLVDTTRSVGAAADKLPPEIKSCVGVIEGQVQEISRQMASAVVAFQFYDKLTQRLGHVRYSLSTLAMFVCDRTQTEKRDQWHRLFTTLRRLYRTEEERQIFQLMADGMSSEEARKRVHENHAPCAAGDIELF